MDRQGPVSGILPSERIEKAILFVRGHKVMLDADLTKLYGVTTFNLNKAIKRNLDRFPGDFMFRLRSQELRDLIFQFGISKTAGHRGRRHLPYAFTEQGVAMLSSVLKSKRAVLVNVAIMRVFVRLRQMLSANSEFAGKLAELERKVGNHNEHIRSRRDPPAHDAVCFHPPTPRLPRQPLFPVPPRRRIGFRED
jgi:ORF6N domain-containing protein